MGDGCYAALHGRWPERSDLVVPKIVITEFFKGEKPLRTDLESERF